LTDKFKWFRRLRNENGRGDNGGDLRRATGLYCQKRKPTCDSLTHSLGLYGP
jgi:hypothetical protein